VASGRWQVVSACSSHTARTTSPSSCAGVPSARPAATANTSRAADLPSPSTTRRPTGVLPAGHRPEERRHVDRWSCVRHIGAHVDRLRHRTYPGNSWCRLRCDRDEEGRCIGWRAEGQRHGASWRNLRWCCDRTFRSLHRHSHHQRDRKLELIQFN